MASPSPLDNLLDRLDGVRRAGKGWIARCPAHDDGNPSLAIAEGDNGVVLVRCHAGCELHQITAAVELSVGDLFPDKVRPFTRNERHEARQRQRFAQWAAALPLLQLEALVILCGAQDIAEGKALSDSDRERYRLALSRISAAKEALGA